MNLRQRELAEWRVRNLGKVGKNSWSLCLDVLQVMLILVFYYTAGCLFRWSFVCFLISFPIMDFFDSVLFFYKGREQNVKKIYS
jgi:hypothetical protein